MTAAPLDPLSKRRLKAWIRLLSVTRQTESRLRERLRLEHGTTLPRFDVMAALWRFHDGLTMSELSRALLVSNGNATVIVDRLEREGLVRRTPMESDRRTVQVKLTPEGKQMFDSMATDHEREVSRLLGNLDAQDLEQLRAILLKANAQDAQPEGL